MLHYVLFSIFLVLLICNYNKTSIAVAALACWLSLFRDPLNTVGNLYLSLSLVISLWGIFKYKKRLMKAPFLWCVVPVFLSYTITMSAHGYFLKQYVVLVAQYLFPCVLYCVMNNRVKVTLFAKYMFGLSLLAVIYCFFEESISANPIMHWCDNHPDSFTWLTDRTEYRFGVKRAQSFFADVVPFGITMSYAFILFLLFKRDEQRLMQKNWRSVILFLLPVCVFMTGTRSVIMCFIMASVSLLTSATIKKYRVQMLVLALFVACFMTPYLGSIYDSIFVDSTEVSGSSSDMREGQWDIAFFYMSQDYWVGNGIGFTGNLLKIGMDGLFGAEGMWLPVMMDRGMIGVIGVLAAFVIGLFGILKTKQYNMVWIWAAFLLMKTITTGVGVEPTYYEVFLVVLLRYVEFNKKSTSKTALCYQ